ncbi:MAG TPA: Stk1 family PASTA domain-containing Ser/Thr kinase [Ilumatobacteraceae bacterium]|nr:Stk1 family PASTA domain-containing Ser/Thr kinase [Ilumatobacteraceae bacterium]
MTDNGERTILNDRYEIQQRIGRGGMADVFLARDLLLDRAVAIKVLFPEFATDPNFVERFRREAQAAANLTHPNIVAVYDWGKYANTYFMAMEYVQGRTLADILRVNGHVNSVQAAEIANEVAAALSNAHAAGVVHRDIKPANILIGGNGQVKVADFGIARAMNAPSENNLTQVGSVMGTATYFSPEQAQGAQPDPRSDLYSLGIVLYEMVAGKPPFVGENPVSIAYKQVHDLPQPLNQIVADVPKPFEAIVAKLLAKDPNMRYPNADLLREDLRRYRTGEPVMALAAVAGAAAAGAAVPSPPRIGDTGAASNVTRSMPRTSATPVPASTTVMARTAMQQQVRAAQRRNNWYGIAAFIVLLALVAGGIILFNALKDKDKGASSFEMPNVVGLQLDVATQMLEDAGLAVNKHEVPTPDAAEGAVVSTTPPAGETVQRDQAVDVNYNPIKAPVPIPDVTGKTVEEATSILTGAGFTVSPDTVFVVDSTLEPGKVLSTNPPFGESAVQGTVVVLTVSQAPDQVSVPDVTGQTSEAAKALLEAEPYAFKVTITSEPNADIPANTVLRTDPALNTPVAKGASVNLIVSAGPAKVRVGVLEGLTEAAARNQLTTKGLVANVQYVTVASGSPDDGHVISQSIPSTEMVLPGTTIRLQVGKAAVPPSTTTTTTTTTIPPTTTTTPPSADLSATITDGTSSVASGATITYTIVVSNDGPSGANGATVAMVPSGLSNVDCRLSNNQVCPGFTGNSINFTVDLAANASMTFTVTGKVAVDSGSTLTNSVTVGSPSGLPDNGPNPNSASDSDTVTP